MPFDTPKNQVETAMIAPDEVPVPRALIEYLESVCPDEYPDMRTHSENERLICYGKVELVRQLRRMHDRQTASRGPATPAPDARLLATSETDLGPPKAAPSMFARTRGL